MACEARISNESLLDYWLGESQAADVGSLEEHLFGCPDCTARLAHLQALQAGVGVLARRGSVGGRITRSLLNQLQRDGLRVRWYSVSPGETVPCAIFPEDDLVVTSLRADFSSTHRATLTVAGPKTELVAAEEFEVSPSDTEVLWAFSGAQGRTIP